VVAANSYADRDLSPLNACGVEFLEDDRKSISDRCPSRWIINHNGNADPWGNQSLQRGAFDGVVQGVLELYNVISIGSDQVWTMNLGLWPVIG
jgi:hypothetical protein